MKLTRKLTRQTCPIVLACYVIAGAAPPGFAFQSSSSASTVRDAEQTPEQLQQLVAPIARYHASSEERRDVGAAFQRFADRLQQFVGGGAFQHVAGGAQPERLGRQLRLGFIVR
jgi:hypothetical protein